MTFPFFWLAVVCYKQEEVGKVEVKLATVLVLHYVGMKRFVKLAQQCLVL